MTTLAEAIEVLVDRRAPNLRAEDFADLMDQFVWSLESNGEEIAKIQRGWLAGDDPYRAEVGLTIGELVPFRDRREAEAVVSRIIAKWPHLEHACRKFSGLLSPPLSSPPHPRGS